MKRLIMLALVALALTGCSATYLETGAYVVERVKLPNGGTVLCVIADSGVDCNWGDK